MRWQRSDVRSLGVGLAYLAPSLILFAAFVFIPLAQTIYLSFFNTRATGAITTFAGLDNYTELLTSATFRTGLLATGIFALYTVPIGIGLGLALAVMLYQRLRGISVFRTMLSSTIAISAAVGALIWLLLFNPSLGLLIGWLDTYQRLAVPFMATALGTFLLRQAFMQVPRDLWDAARIDCASTFRFLISTVIPLSRPALGTVAIWRIHQSR